MLEKALENIRVLCHSSIKFEKEKTIYFDPFKVDKNYNDADIIFITHSHYDHFSEEDILKVKKSRRCRQDSVSGNFLLKAGCRKEEPGLPALSLSLIV